MDSLPTELLELQTRFEPGAPAANTSGNRCRTNSEARRWRCSGVTLLRSSVCFL